MQLLVIDDSHNIVAGKTVVNKNLRVTALEEFWGNEYPESIYLWQGAKHELTIQEIINHRVPTLDDAFSTGDQMNEARDHCQELYFRLLPVLSSKLNDIHNTEYGDAFWTTALGYWLYRHICITYDKYIHLEQVDIDNSSLVLLDERSFTVPSDHGEYLRCFSSDFGVQQLVSAYCYLFATKDFPKLRRKFVFESDNPIDKKNLVQRVLKYVMWKFSKAMRRLRTMATVQEKLNQSKEPSVNAVVALCGLHYIESIYTGLVNKSKGLIKNNNAPALSSSLRKVNLEKRRKLAQIESADNFYKYFFQTLAHCFPKRVLEQFPELCKAYQADIKKKMFKYIVSEDWISNLNNSIYIALAQNAGSKFICHEHAASQVLFEKNMLWMDYLAADRFISVGWGGKDEKTIKGGLCSKEIVEYVRDPGKQEILFLSHIRFPYLMVFTGYHMANSSYVSDLSNVYDFIHLLDKTGNSLK